jgi:hypothetical protein
MWLLNCPKDSIFIELYITQMQVANLNPSNIHWIPCGRSRLHRIQPKKNPNFCQHKFQLSSPRANPFQLQFQSYHITQSPSISYKHFRLLFSFVDHQSQLSARSSASFSRYFWSSSSKPEGRVQSMSMMATVYHLPN